MNILHYIVLGFTFVILTSFEPTESMNCNQSMKDKCKKVLSPYIHNGQFNTLALQAGQSISANMTFYSGHKYRILTCHQGELNEVYFDVKTEQDQVIYSSKGKDNLWDFAVESSTNLKVQIYRESSVSSNDLACVGVLIGFKE